MRFGDLPVGLVANTAAVLSLTLGKTYPELIGPDVLDADGDNHKGITTISLPILQTTAGQLKEIRSEFKALDSEDVFIVDFTNAAQTTKAYEYYEQKIKTMDYDDLDYLGIAVYGKKKIVNKLTGHLSLMR